MASAARVARVRELQDDTPKNVCDRITARLDERIRKERDVWLRDDYQIAWLTVRWSFRGVPKGICYSDHPYVAATYQTLHCHPEQVWKLILTNRKARLEKEMSDWYDAAGNLKSDLPKKKPSIYIADEEAERATKERLAGVLMFPTTALQFADMEQKNKKGKLVEMPSATARQLPNRLKQRSFRVRTFFLCFVQIIASVLRI